MTNDKNNLTVINLDRPRFLRYGHKALKMMSALTGKSLQDMDMSNFGLEDLEVILYCGLLSDAKANNETLKLDEMEDLLDEAESFQVVIEKMSEALNKAFGQAEQPKGKKGKN